MTPVREDFTDFVFTPAQMRATIAAGGSAQPVVRTAGDLEAAAEHAAADLAYNIGMAARRG